MNGVCPHTRSSPSYTPDYKVSVKAPFAMDPIHIRFPLVRFLLMPMEDVEASAVSGFVVVDLL